MNEGKERSRLPRLGSTLETLHACELPCGKTFCSSPHQEEGVVLVIVDPLATAPTILLLAGAIPGDPMANHNLEERSLLG